MGASSLRQVVRFLVVGGCNTAITYGLYLLLTLGLAPGPAYAIAYAVGIGIAFLGNRTWVFGSRRRWTAIAPYAAAQLALLGLGSLVAALVAGRLAPWVAGLSAIAVVLPLSFAVNRAFFAPPSSASR